MGMQRRTTRAGFPVRPRGSRQRERVEIINPSFGLDDSAPFDELRPGYTPKSQNLVTDFRGITPRSGLSGYGGMATDVATPVLGGGEYGDRVGNWYAVVASARTVSWLKAGQEASWSTLSYTGTDQMSGNSRSYWNMEAIYDSGLTEFMVVLTNNVDQPKFFELSPDAATFSDFTFLNSLMSVAKDVIAHDDRLVFFNVRADDVRLPTSVVYTPRGNPTSQLILSGAGRQDLLDMKGVGQRIAKDREGLLLFSDREIWRGRARRDIFAYDFFRLTDNFACPFPRTVANCAAGVVFIAQDLECYIISGNVIQPLGPGENGAPSRIKKLLRDEMAEGDRMWASFSPRLNRYELYFKDTSTSFPDRALYYDFETGAWFEQKLDGHELSFGFSYADPEPAPAETWQQQGDTWDQQITVWDEAGLPVRAAYESVDVMAFSSNGTAYRFRSNQTTDDGTAIDWRWRSHGMGRMDQRGFERLDQVWIEYDANSTSSCSVFGTPDGGATFDAGFALSLRSSDLSVDFVPLLTEGRAPQFEIRGSDGGTPRFRSFEARLRGSSKFGGGP